MVIRLGVFSAQPYEEKAINAEADGTLEIQYFPVALNESTLSLCDGLDVICVFVNDDVNSTIISKLAEYGVFHIALRCAGYNNVDLEAAKQHDIAVSHVPAYGPEAVAEHAVALMLTLNRKMHKAYNRVKDGNFNLNGLLGFNMSGKTAGIIGTGHIGRATANILMGFGCHALCVDPFPDKHLQNAGARYTDLDTLLSQSDIISLHCPLNEDSYHLINDNTISKMKKGVMLINTSRGGLTDTHALINGLKSHQIGYLGLDVYEMESELFFRDHSCEIIQDDVFERLSTFHNVLITGHQGFFTQEALSQISAITLKNINAWHQGSATSDSFLVRPKKG